MLARAQARLRRAARGPGLLAALLLGLLLAQPTLCVVHCATVAHIAHAGDGQHLLCSLGEGEAAPGEHILVPAFWPSLPALFTLALLLVTLRQTLPPPAAARLISCRYSPPLPPPRHS